MISDSASVSVVHFIPDLLFRAPSPIIMIATLTVRTLQIYKNRRVGTNTIQVNRRRNIPFMLTLLNIKFILCNTLYMFNTILMEVMGYGGKRSSQQTDHETIQYIRSLYLTDFSNMLITLHSATNWLLFYHWTICNKTNGKQCHSIGSTSTYKSSIDPNDAYNLLVHFSPQKYKIGTDIIARLCSESKELAEALIPNASELEKESLRDNKAIQAHGKVLADFIESALHSLACKLTSLNELQAKCRQVGMTHFRANVNLTAAHWKVVRDLLVLSCSTTTNTKGKREHSTQKEDEMLNLR
ncbi:unnamed protein product [Anisakis simplex]|uniref:GLOBIN domain-containing protein n=1 Tax=Anisakis simplex TaxID=6269 RepID=A0A0M3K8I7_ANISI|nr:unnamed protein product [Anisakis simplex]